MDSKFFQFIKIEKKYDFAIFFLKFAICGKNVYQFKKKFFFLEKIRQK